MRSTLTPLAGAAVLALVAGIEPAWSQTILNVDTSHHHYRHPEAAVPGEFLVKRSPGAASVGTRSLGAVGGREAAIPGLDVSVVRVSATVGTRSVGGDMQSLAQDPNVDLVEPNYYFYTATAPNDPLLNDMWFLRNIRAVEAWGVQTGREEVIVAVIDTGIQFDHEDLRANMWVNPNELAGSGRDDDRNGFVDDVFGWNFYDNTNNPYAEFAPKPMPDCSPHPSERQYEAHGTHVAGTIGAVGGNGIGITGISQRVRIMALKALGGPCGSGSTAGIIASIQYALLNGADVINLSLGGGSRSQILEETLRIATRRGIIVVAAAGNEGKDNDQQPSYPASYELDGIIAVAASDPGDALTSFSNFGVRSVHLAAPGINILSTVPGGNDPRGAQSAYANLAGTSMATPVVAGAVALMLSQYPDLSPREVRERLLSTADPVGALQGRTITGGRLNIAAALAAGGGNGAAPPPATPDPAPAPAPPPPQAPAPAPPPPPVAQPPASPPPAPPVAPVRDSGNVGGIQIN